MDEYDGWYSVDLTVVCTGSYQKVFNGPYETDGYDTVEIAIKAMGLVLSEKEDVSRKRFQLVNAGNVNFRSYRTYNKGGGFSIGGSGGK